MTCAPTWSLGRLRAGALEEGEYRRLLVEAAGRHRSRGHSCLRPARAAERRRWLLRQLQRLLRRWRCHRLGRERPRTLRRVWWRLVSSWSRSEADLNEDFTHGIHRDRDEIEGTVRILLADQTDPRNVILRYHCGLPSADIIFFVDLGALLLVAQPWSAAVRISTGDGFAAEGVPIRAMDHHICVTCGAQYGAATEPPPSCLICEDEQYVGHQGQRWTTLAELRRAPQHRRPIEPGLTGFTTEPRFAIGQQAHHRDPSRQHALELHRLVDDDTVAAIERRGGLAAIAVSHPHFFTGVASGAAPWRRAGFPPRRRPGVGHPSRRSDRLLGGRYGGSSAGEWSDAHPLRRAFPGSCVLHWAAGAGGAGALLTGDTIQVVADRRW